MRTHDRNFQGGLEKEEEKTAEAVTAGAFTIRDSMECLEKIWTKSFSFPGARASTVKARFGFLSRTRLSTGPCDRLIGEVRGQISWGGPRRREVLSECYGFLNQSLSAGGAWGSAARRKKEGFRLRILTTIYQYPGESAPKVGGASFARGLNLYFMNEVSETLIDAEGGEEINIIVKGVYAATPPRSSEDRKQGYMADCRGVKGLTGWVKK